MKKKKYKFPQRFKRLRRMANNRCKIFLINKVIYWKIKS